MASSDQRRARSRGSGGIALAQALNAIGATSPRVVGVLLLVFLGHEILVTRGIAAIDAAFDALASRPREYLALWALLTGAVVAAAFLLAGYIRGRANVQFEITCTRPAPPRGARSSCS